MSGVGVPTFVFPAGVGGNSNIGALLTGNTGSSEMAPGTFHGMSILEAVRKLLSIRKRMMTAQEIATDLRTGGLHLQTDTPSNTVTSVLSRAFSAGAGDIVRVSRGQWGLQEWYPTQRVSRKSADE